jgi:demethylmenaquinone methyltransferase / 2-methoxy-6-polyprenyl-1,4-benzoquinol methylase
MFAAIAGRYDLNNRVHSLGRDQAWRRFAVRHALVIPGDRVLDVACGTGDLTEQFARTDAAEVLGVDFTPEMLEVARRKLSSKPEIKPKVAYREGDAQALDLPDAAFDVVSIAFGIRNVADPARAIREFSRVLRPGGRLMPRTATLISGDRSGAYRYLPRSVGAFMPREAMMGLLESGGFERVTATPLTLGICVCYRAFRRA